MDDPVRATRQRNAESKSRRRRLGSVRYRGARPTRYPDNPELSRLAPPFVMSAVTCSFPHSTARALCPTIPRVELLPAFSRPQRAPLHPEVAHHRLDRIVVPLRGQPDEKPFQPNETAALGPFRRRGSEAIDSSGSMALPSARRGKRESAGAAANPGCSGRGATFGPVDQGGLPPAAGSARTARTRSATDASPTIEPSTRSSRREAPRASTP